MAPKKKKKGKREGKSRPEYHYMIMKGNHFEIKIVNLKRSFTMPILSATCFK
jgi:hypothetical protein